MDALVPVSPAAVLVAPTSPAARLVAAFLDGRNPRTLDAYRRDLEDFRVFLGVADVAAAARVLLDHGHGPANETALRYRTDLVTRTLAPATVNRRLAAVRSLVKLARLLGFVSWTLDVQAVKSERYRDTRGPGRVGVVRLFVALEGRTTPKAIRDVAILRLLYDLALRRGEVVSLDLADLDLEAGTVAVLGKGRSARVKLTLPDPTRAALATWVLVRGSEAGPLFPSFDRSRKSRTENRVTGRSVARLVAEVGTLAGLGAVRPHGLRHAAITEALSLTRGDVRAVQRFSRHRDLRVLTIYDDNLQDLGGDVARLVAVGMKGVGK